MCVVDTGDTVAGQLDIIKSAQPELGPDLSPLALSIARLAPDILRVKIVDPEGQRWQVPAELFGSRSGEGSRLCMCSGASIGMCECSEGSIGMHMRPVFHIAA